MNAQEIQAVAGRLKEGPAKPGPKRRRQALVETGVMLDLAERAALDMVAEQSNQSRSALIREGVRLILRKHKGAAN